MPQSWDMGQILSLPLRRKACRGKIQRLGPRLNPRTRVPEASMLTTRKPKPSLRVLDVHYPAHNSLSVVRIYSRMNEVYMTYFVKYLQIIFFYYRRVASVSACSLFLFPPRKFCTPFLALPCMLHAPYMSSTRFN